MINISHEHKCFLWLPPKTGTMRATDIFNGFGFRTETTPDEKQIEFKRQGDVLAHHHEMILFNGHKEYKLICTARNPYTRMVSYFKMSTTESNENLQDRFLSFLTRFFYPSSNDKVFYNKRMNFNENWELRIPDYYIKIESMYEDYLKLPFTLESEIYKTGKLKTLCGIKKNENIRNLIPWKEFYSEESADMVYYNFAKYFDLLGYDKKSYK